MSITPLTSREPAEAGPYTMVGGEALDRGERGRPGLSIVLINRGARPFRGELFEELSKIGVREVISIESVPHPFDLESLSRRHDTLRFMIFARESSLGARIDAAFREVLSDHAFVMHGDMHLSAAGISSRVFSKISERGRVCTVPVFRDDAGETLPTAVGPMRIRGGSLEPQPALPGRGETPTLIPWDYTGIYRVDKHRRTGGFDPLITEPWWQKLEYGMRCWLWGEEIIIHPALKVDYLEPPIPEDTSRGPGYRRFFLKTLAPRRRGDAGRLSRLQWWAYLRRSRDHAGAAGEDWREIRRWMKGSRYRFRRDAAALADLWDWGD